MNVNTYVACLLTYAENTMNLLPQSNELVD